MNIWILCATFLLCSCSSLASGQEIGHQLTAKYANKFLIFRSPTHRNSLRFTSTGTPMNQSKGGSWTVDGPMEITKIELAPDKLRVKGLRVVLVYDRASQEFVAEREKRPDSVQAEILLDSALN